MTAPHETIVAGSQMCGFNLFNKIFEGTSNREYEIKKIVKHKLYLDPVRCKSSLS